MNINQKTMSYAYATSDTAVAAGHCATGCYVIENGATGDVQYFPDQRDAVAAFVAIDLPASYLSFYGPGDPQLKTRDLADIARRSVPEIITCHGGKRAKLVEPPHWDEVNQCWLVSYENDQITFHLHFPEMRFHGTGGEPHWLDAVNADETGRQPGDAARPSAGPITCPQCDSVDWKQLHRDILDPARDRFVCKKCDRKFTRYENSK